MPWTPYRAIVANQGQREEEIAAAMPFQCSICGEESTRICARCTKDACDNHLCEKCLRCSDCCECEVALAETSHDNAQLHAAAPLADESVPVAEPEAENEIFIAEPAPEPGPELSAAAPGPDPFPSDEPDTEPPAQ